MPLDANTFHFSEWDIQTMVQHWLGRDLNSAELDELTKMAREHLHEYVSEAIITNAGVEEKLRVWKKVEGILGRALTNEERGYIQNYLDKHSCLFGLDETNLMETVKSWISLPLNEK